ncbi:MAG: type II toxin-antitoxin system RelB/DinJ family antitoxin [Clostridia bacterium]|nr:type II toxin-antitoxin system RelB/DinJ family antitoxin [Clostridia bacterium]
MTTINVRVDENVKKQANALFEELGLDMSTALNLFLRQAISYGGIPFEIRRPNAATLAALEEVEQIKRGELKAKRYNSVDALFADLEAE